MPISALNKDISEIFWTTFKHLKSKESALSFMTISYLLVCVCVCVLFNSWIHHVLTRFMWRGNQRVKSEGWSFWRAFFFSIKKICFDRMEVCLDVSFFVCVESDLVYFQKARSSIFLDFFFLFKANLFWERLGWSMQVRSVQVRSVCVFSCDFSTRDKYVFLCWKIG